MPTVDGTATDEAYRDAYVTYYSDLTVTLIDITDRMNALAAPTFAGGQDCTTGTWLTSTICRRSPWGRPW